MPVDLSDKLFPGMAYPNKYQEGEIDGVVFKTLLTHLSEDGEFKELLRADDNIYGNQFKEFAQANYSVTFPGMIKGIHLHQNQDDCWFVASGQAKVMLVDLRIKSQTFGNRKTIILGEAVPRLLVIPRGVGHGFKVLGNKNLVMVYFVSAFYGDQDEGHIRWNDPRLGFKWETNFD